MLKKLTSYKDRQFLVFECEDGSIVKYNLATGETIGKRGNVVKGLQSQLKGYSIIDLINTFPDENYRNFLSYINNQSNRTRCGTPKVTNIGSFLSKIKSHSRIEQFFACGIKNVDNITCKITDIPKGLLKLAREYNIPLTQNMIKYYTESPDMFNLIIPMECYSLTVPDKVYLLTDSRYDYNIHRYITFLKDMMDTYHYNLKSLVTYLDNLVTYEGLNPRQIGRELRDYCKMMSELSPKYEKYPRHFLTTHRIAVRNYERLKKHFDEEKFNAVKDLKLETTIDDMKIIYPTSTQDIKDEAVQQANCVASYIDKVVNGRSHILFGRYALRPDESILTIEVQDYKVIQVKGKHNRDITDKEQVIIEQYNKKLQRLKEKRLDISA